MESDLSAISTLLAIDKRLDSIDRRLDAIEKLGVLVEAALGALAIQSQNAHKLEIIEARVRVAEDRLLAVESKVA